MWARLLTLCGAIAVVAAIGWWWTGGSSGEVPVPAEVVDDAVLWEAVPPGQLAPQDNYLQRWADLFGGDIEVTDATAAGLAAADASDLAADQLPAARTAAAAAATARLTDPAALEAYNAGDPFPGDEPDDRWAGRCSDVDVAAVGVMALPGAELVGGSWAKAAVLYRGNCPDGLGDGALRITYVYLSLQGDTWVPVRPSQVPWSANTAVVGGNGIPSDNELVAVEGCALADGVDARLLAEAAATLEVMCADASADGVELEIVSAFRRPEEQAERAAAAAARFDDPNDAQRWVASADADGCASRHCAGAAVDIGNSAGRSWLSETVGCLSGATVVAVGDAGCGDAAAVPRSASYGWVAPLRAQPWHYEYTWPATTDVAPTSCSPPTSMSAPEIVASVWRCRLGAVGLDAETVRQRAAEAVQVARCTSGWNPAAVVAGGRWVNTPDPATGTTRDGSGVFLLSSADADRFAPGGATGRNDTRANAAGAAAAWIAEVADGGTGWSRWPCAARVAPSAGGVALDRSAYAW